MRSGRVQEPVTVQYKTVSGTANEGEDFSDDNSNGVWDLAEVFVDELNGIYDEGEDFTDDNGNGQWDDSEECNDDESGQSCEDYGDLVNCNCNYRDLYERGLAPSYLIVSYADEIFVSLKKK